MKISPIKKYKTPGYPTRNSVSSNPDLVRKNIPSSWKTNKVIPWALSLYFLTSNNSKTNVTDKIQTEIVPKEVKPDALPAEETTNENPVAIAPVFVHGNGTGSWGCVVINPPAFMNEADARYIIEEELAKEGIFFDKKDVIVDEIVFERNYENLRYRLNELDDDENSFDHFISNKREKVDTLVIDGYCSKLNLAYEYITADDEIKLGGEISGSSVSSYDTKKAAENLREKLKEYGKINAVVFYDPFYSTEIYGRSEDEENNLDSVDEINKIENQIDGSMVEQTWYYDREQISKGSVELLKKQVRDFIFWLKKEGILIQK